MNKLRKQLRSVVKVLDDKIGLLSSITLKSNKTLDCINDDFLAFVLIRPDDKFV